MVDQLAGHAAGKLERGPKMHRQQFIPVLHVQLDRRAAHEVARRVDEDVDPAERFAGLGEQAIGLAGLTQVGCHGDTACPALSASAT